MQGNAERRIKIECIGKIYAETNMRYVMRRAFARMGDTRNACKILVGKLEGKRPFERQSVSERVLAIPAVHKKVL
jgi:hypothetical protein